MNVLVIDNIDSFVYNLVQYLGEEGAKPIVFDNRASMREISSAVRKNRVERIVISPGPKRPEEAGVSNEVIRRFGPKIPILGVCLGHECIGYVYGAKIRQAKTLKHGKTSMISHCCGGIFTGLPNPFEAVRYHSLVLDDMSMPECLRVCAISNDDKEVMAVEHKKHPVTGVQFHPESIMTKEGKRVIRNFLNLPF
ncbi:MAG: aminodeoxychorismate/anthranilate synthase component II [Candidatus Altiarchaeota archaeon]|nr:aminodeoxychorismate/anthranilate synthase component II [Candidatus Altiarchaeota archaeon]